MNRKAARLSLIVGCLTLLGIAGALVLYALNDTIVFFRSPSDVVENKIGPGERFRLGGLVREGSFVRGSGTEIKFVVTDGAEAISVTYDKPLPDLFREGQGVITEGSLGSNGIFVADTVLAKHDENYMPPEVAEALKKRGFWQGKTPVGDRGGDRGGEGGGEGDANATQ